MATRTREKAKARFENREMRPHAVAKMIRISPYKVRKVLDLIRGKSYPYAVALLSEVNKSASEPILKVLNSAAANAENNLNMNKDTLYVVECPSCGDKICLDESMLEEGESVEDCARRELYEETGLRVTRFIDILPPSYSAVGFSDTATWLVFLEAEGNPRTVPAGAAPAGAACAEPAPADAACAEPACAKPACSGSSCGSRLSENEEISADFYTREQIGEMLKTETFSSRSQTVAWFFKNGCLPGRGEAGEV